MKCLSITRFSYLLAACRTWHLTSVVCLSRYLWFMLLLTGFSMLVIFIVERYSSESFSVWKKQSTIRRCTLWRRRMAHKWAYVDMLYTRSLLSDSLLANRSSRALSFSASFCTPVTIDICTEEINEIAMLALVTWEGCIMTELVSKCLDSSNESFAVIL